MRRAILALCLIASVWSFHLGQVGDFNIKVKETQIVNHPGQKVVLDHIVPLEELVHEPKVKPSPRITSAVLNEFGDEIYANVQAAIVQNGLDPLQLPDIHQSFTFTLIIEYEGSISLTSGWLSDVSTIHRGAEDLVVTYDPTTEFLEITLPVTFNDLLFTYDYAAEIIGLGPSGYIDGKVVSPQIEAKIGLRAETIDLVLDSFEIIHAGTIELNFHGDALIDWLLNLLSDVVITLLHDVVVDIVAGFVGDALQGIIDTLNDAINNVLEPSTTVGPEAITVPSVFRRY